MNRFLKLCATFFLALFFVATANAAAENFTLDPMHTFVLWKIKHLGFSTQAGKWYATGTLTLDKDAPKNSKVNVKIAVAEVVTGLPELDKHLNGKLFFNTSEFPEATFVSEKVDVTGKNTANVHGILTLRGVSKPVTLKVMLNQVGKNPVSEKMTAGFSAATKIKRSDFGLTALLPALGDEVNLDIEAEAVKSAE